MPSNHSFLDLGEYPGYHVQAVVLTSNAIDAGRTLDNVSDSYRSVAEELIAQLEENDAGEVGASFQKDDGTITGMIVVTRDDEVQILRGPA